MHVHQTFESTMQAARSRSTTTSEPAAGAAASSSPTQRRERPAVEPATRVPLSRGARGSTTKLRTAGSSQAGSSSASPSSRYRGHVCTTAPSSSR